MDGVKLNFIELEMIENATDFLEKDCDPVTSLISVNILSVSSMRPVNGKYSQVNNGQFQLLINEKYSDLLGRVGSCLTFNISESKEG